MLHLKIWNIFIVIAFLFLAGCNSKEEPEARPEPEKKKLSGKQCFEYSDDILELKVTLTIDDDNNVSGYQTGTITNDAVGYYTSYTSTFSGKLEGNILKVSVSTKIENDRQETDQEWKLEGDNLFNRANKLTRINCR